MAKKEGKAITQTPPSRTELSMRRGGLSINSLDQAYRFGQYLASSDIVPDNYKGKPNDCLVAIDLAGRLGVSWMAIMQNVYPVHGRPGMMAVLVLSLINSSGVFTDPLDYEVSGDDPDKDDYKVRAFATRKSTGKVLYGPWITWQLVKGEGWDRRGGSKWKTMPDQMFHYRAASWFANRHCPEVKMGMMTTDEAEEMPPRRAVESHEVEPGVAALKERIKAQTEQPPADDPVPEPEERDAETEAKVTAQKQALADAEETATVAAGEGGSNLF